ncbi:MAG: ABC transporter ATP-binding protein [Candidatus Omnitrophica bacterium]|nr:ABC transporter ATP-binding protein [Candidatus Omnitrophota bacterium]
MFKKIINLYNKQGDNGRKMVRLEKVGKAFRLLGHSESLFPRLSGNNTEEYWALKNIDMEVEKGRIVGIIGRNGSGKTTLLNILAGIFAPTEGRVGIDGRASSILSLGAGFKSELSAKENIFLNGLILGMSRGEIREKLDSIIEFSELKDFMDIPVQSFSQGMQLRLAFSIAIHVDFDILLIDEVISVGDLSFQKRCYEKIIDFKRKKKTMLISTHDLDIIERICDEAYLLENGRLVRKGEPAEVNAFYRRLASEKRFSKNQ